MHDDITFRDSEKKHDVHKMSSRRTYLLNGMFRKSTIPLIVHCITRYMYL